MRSLRVAAACLAASLLLLVYPAPPAEARGPQPGDDGVVEYPSGLVPNELTLAQALASPDVHTVIFNKGTNPFANPIYVFRRRGLRLCGRTGNAKDVEIDSSAPVAILLDECSDIEISDLTIRSSTNAGECVRMQSAASTEVEGFVRNVRVESCVLESAIPVRGLVRSSDLQVRNCTIQVTRTNGAGVLWEDGDGLFVTRNRFSTATGATAIAAVFVRGAQVSTAEGQRARRIFLTRNRVGGDFTTGFDLADVVDAQVQHNDVEFDTPTFLANQGRVGCVVRRAVGSAPTQDVEVRRNRFHGAHTGVWMLTVGPSFVERNDVRGCGTAAVDARFGDTGCALRIGLLGAQCDVRVAKNDFRALRSPLSAPACIVTPAGNERLCFDFDPKRTDDVPADLKNKVESGRKLFLGAQ